MSRRTFAWIPIPLRSGIMRIRPQLLALALSTILAFAAGAAAESHAPYDVLTYRLAVTLDFSENPGPDSPYRPYFSVLNKLEAEATIRLTNVSQQPQEEVSLVLHRLMKASAIASGGQALEFTQDLRSLENWENFHINHLTE